MCKTLIQHNQITQRKYCQKANKKQLTKVYQVKFFNKTVSLFLILMLALMLFELMVIDYSKIKNTKIVKDTEWSLPQLINSRANVNDKNSLNQLNLWNSFVSASYEPAVKVVNSLWQLKGIVFNEKNAYVLILNSKDNKLKSYKVKEMLPNGEQIATISNSAITYVKDNQTFTLELYRK